MFWRSRKLNRPAIIIEVGEDDRAYVRCDWPVGLSTEKQVHMAKMLASAINYLEVGKFRPLILQAIVLAGKLKKQDELAAYILQEILNGLARLGPPAGGDDEDYDIDDDDEDGGDDGDSAPREEPPIISPDRVFMQEGNP